MLTKYKEVFLEDTDGYRYRIRQDGDEMMFIEYQEWTKEGVFLKKEEFSFPNMHLEQIIEALNEVK